jgi:Ca2+-binding EF-hand superfamily protein
LQQVDDAWVLDEDDWRKLTKEEATFLLKFLNDQYEHAPKRMWRIRVGTRIGFDNLGVYMHENHHRRYFGLTREKAPLVLEKDCPEAVPVFEHSAERGTDSTENFLSGLHDHFSSSGPSISDDMRYKVLQASFKRADRNGNKLLSRPELGIVFRKVVRTMTGAQVEDIMRAADLNRDGNVNYEEFVNWLQQTADEQVRYHFVNSMQDECDIVKATFRVWDQDGDGLIENRKLCKVLLKLFPDSTAKQISAMTDIIDTDNSGTIDYDEFVDFLFNRSQQQ